MKNNNSPTLKLKSFTKDNQFYYANKLLISTHKGLIHNHDFYEFYLVASNSLTYIYNQKTYILYKDDIQLILPDDEHQFSAHNKDTCRLINIAFSKSLLLPCLEKQLTLFKKYKDDFHQVIIPDFLLLTIKYQIHLLSLEKNLKNQQFILNTILMNYLSNYNQQFSPTNATLSHLQPLWLVKSLEIISQDHNYLKGIDFFIKTSGKTQEHLTRSLKKYYETTPTKYLNKLKLKYAASLLSETNALVLDIIYMSGFNNISYFNRLFKNHYHCTPSEYRNKLNNIFMQANK